MSKQKAADEIFCRSCGEAIKKEAEICPACGVRNSDQPKKSSGPTSFTHDPSDYETTVGATWYYGVAAAVVLWVLTMATFDSVTGTTETVLSFAALAAWILMPVATFYDAKYIRANSLWNPNTVAWVGAAVVPIVNVASGVFYLYRRHEALGKP